MSAIWQVYIIPDGNGDTIGFDGIKGESHEATSEVTEHPVELGSNIADNVRQNPKTLTLELYVTNTPIYDNGKGSVQSLELNVPDFSPPLAPTPGSLFRTATSAIRDAISGRPKPPKISVLTFPTPFDAIQDTYNALSNINDSGGTVSVLTSVKTYESMVFTRVSLPRDEPGKAVFTLDLKNIKTVTTGSVSAPKPLLKSGAPAVKKGAQSPKPVGGADAVKASSALINGLISLGAANAAPGGP